MIARLAAIIVMLVTALPVAALELKGHFTPGGLVRGVVTPGSAVTLDGVALIVDDSGRFVFGFDRDAKGHVTLIVRHPDGSEQNRVLTISPREFLIQRIDGLPAKMVTPDQATLARIAEETARLHQARRLRRADAWLWGGFTWPVAGPLSGVYGSQRILNGEPRNPHNGLDIAAPRGAPVAAPAPGIVRLAAADFYFTGGTVVLDHGHGVMSTFAHLDRVDVTEGAQLEAGAVIGAVGATGRATGPHLHWGVNWGDVRLDPALLLEPITP